jgi:hypothetical protein
MNKGGSNGDCTSRIVWQDSGRLQARIDCMHAANPP